MTFAVKDLGLSIKAAIWDESLTTLMLMAREVVFEKNPNMITLADKEVIDKWPNTK